MTRDEAAIITAYTGYLIGSFSDFHAYAERLLGRPIWTHQFADKELMEEIGEKAKPDFVALSESIAPEQGSEERSHD